MKTNAFFRGFVLWLLRHVLSVYPGKDVFSYVSVYLPFVIVILLSDSLSSIVIQETDHRNTTSSPIDDYIHRCIWMWLKHFCFSDSEKCHSFHCVWRQTFLRFKKLSVNIESMKKKMSQNIVTLNILKHLYSSH